MKRIFAKAEEPLSDEQKEKGSVPPRVLKGILDDGSFCNDELTASYFAAYLRVSKSEVERDDRGATLTALIGRLSTYQAARTLPVLRACAGPTRRASRL